MIYSFKISLHDLTGFDVDPYINCHIVSQIQVIRYFLWRYDILDGVFCVFFEFYSRYLSSVTFLCAFFANVIFTSDIFLASFL